MADQDVYNPPAAELGAHDAAVNYIGFWMRVVAALVDTVAYMIVLLPFSFIVPSVSWMQLAAGTSGLTGLGLKLHLAGYRGYSFLEIQIGYAWEDDHRCKDCRCEDTTAFEQWPACRTLLCLLPVDIDSRSGNFVG
jgi:hypothetical protein